MTILYQIAISFYVMGIHLAAFFSPKAKLWVEGRKGWRRDLVQQVAALPKERIWIHCASLGEFEQGRPIIESLNEQFPQIAILLTFYSPSGFTIRKDYPYADLVCYLPADTPSNARFFVQTLQPSLAIFVKYELWYFYLKNLQQAKIPTYLISAIFHPRHIFFKWYGSLFRKMLQMLSGIFVQNEQSEKLLYNIGIQPLAVTGDTRIDRVYQLVLQAEPIPLIDKFAGSSKLFIAGSTWPPDEALLAPLLANNWPEDWKMIIAPHDISERHIRQIEQALPYPHQRYSDAQKNSLNLESKALIINNIGLLSRIYQYGTIAYIGGGFGKGIHNTLEPLTFGLPVIVGPKYQKFDEAVQMIAEGAMFSIHNKEELEDRFKKLQNEDLRRNCAFLAKQFIKSSAGATQKTIEVILRDIPTSA